MADTVKKNLGIVTAYGYAISKGYSGTEEEFAELMASYADVAQDAEASAQAAAQSATTAEQKATQAARSATNAAVSAESAETLAQVAAGSSNSASLYAQNASASATNAAGSASSASTYAGNASASAQDAESSANAAQESATQAAGSADDAEAAKDIILGMNAVAETLPAGSQATASYSNGTLTLGIPKGDTGEKGDPGDTNDAPLIYSSASGSIANFADGANDMAMKSAVVSIEPIQDLHGYDYPWPAGGGKNKFNPKNYNETISGVNIVSDGSGKIVFSGTSTGAFWYRVDRGGLATPEPLVLPSGEYIISASDIPSNQVYVRFNDGADHDLTVNNPSYTFTSDGTTKLVINVRVQSGVAFGSGTNISIMIRLASVTDATFAPYSNICPISGRTGVTVSHSGADTSDPVTISVNWETEAGTVYGGTLDVVSGKLTVDRAYIASYSGETLPSTWISDRDVYAEGTAPTTGAQVVYKLANPVEYQLIPQEIRTLLGENNIWSDGGDVTVEYPADTKMYIDQKITEAIAAAMA